MSFNKKEDHVCVWYAPRKENEQNDWIPAIVEGTFPHFLGTAMQFFWASMAEHNTNWIDAYITDSDAQVSKDENVFRSHMVYKINTDQNGT